MKYLIVFVDGRIRSSKRILNLVEVHGIKSLSELRLLTWKKMIRTKGCGRKTIAELESILGQKFERSPDMTANGIVGEYGDERVVSMISKLDITELRRRVDDALKTMEESTRRLCEEFLREKEF